jgi:hypothetical protein
VDDGGTHLTEYQSRKSCEICQDNKATHLCEDCGASLCNDCMDLKSSKYYVCSECHHIIEHTPFGEKPVECPECQSQNLSIGKRSVSICPRCHSVRVVLVEEKRRVLAQELRYAIMSIQYGHIRLKELSNKLESCKELLVSLRMANFLHYQWLEDRIENIQKEIPAIKKRIGSQAEIVAKQIAAETKGVIDYDTWSPEQFSFIEGIKNRVTQIGLQYERNVDDTLKIAKNDLEEIAKHLDGLSYYRKYFNGFYEHAELSVNELPVCAFPEMKLVGSDFLKHDRAQGILYITNKRLVFIAETGIVRKKEEIIFDFPLVYLKGIEEEGRLRKKLVLCMKHGNIKIDCSDQTKRVLPDYLEIANGFDKYIQTDLARVRRLEQSQCNISDVRLKIESLVYSLLSVNGRFHPYETPETLFQPRIHISDWAKTRPFTSNERSEYIQSPRSLRNRLEQTLERATRSNYRTDIRNDQTEIDSLTRNSHAIERAIDETIRLMRDGRLIPEDFIRRYKGLMRDSYWTKKQLQHQTDNDGYLW